MDQQTVVFIGRSGCGKGTQSDLLVEYLSKRDPSRGVYHLQIGQEFREYIKGEGYAQNLSREIYQGGGLQPIFLTVWLWGKALIDNFKENQHIIIDGTPRRPAEVPILEDAFRFFKRDHVSIVHLSVSKEWSTERLKKRGRSDDLNDEEIVKRMNWFESDVLPTIERLKENRTFRFYEVNGEQSIEAVHQEVTEALFASNGTH